MPGSPALSLYMLDSGMLGVGGVEVPVPFFLARHPQEDVIVDGAILWRSHAIRTHIPARSRTSSRPI